MKEVLSNANTSKIVMFALLAYTVVEQLMNNPAIPQSWKPTLVMVGTVATTMSALFTSPVKADNPTANIRTVPNSEDAEFNPLKPLLDSGELKPAVLQAAESVIEPLKMNVESQAIANVVLSVVKDHKDLNTAFTAEAIDYLAKQLTKELNK